MAPTQKMIICPYPFCNASWSGLGRPHDLERGSLLEEAGVLILSDSQVACDAARCKRSA